MPSGKNICQTDSENWRFVVQKISKLSLFGKKRTTQGTEDSEIKTVLMDCQKMFPSIEWAERIIRYPRNVLFFLLEIRNQEKHYLSEQCFS